MPHATLPSPGFQALILCGPGASFSTFTSTPRDIPKALLPIANRPMVWYPLEWCYRMGVTDITIITPPESLDAIEAAMSQNPHLTSLPAPRPEVLAPRDLTHETGTGDLFRLPEVQAAVKGDFIVLPCDLVCELDGTALADAWMVEQAGFPGAVAGEQASGKTAFGAGGERVGRRGGLGVWYQTKGEGSRKGDETDFIATTPLPTPIVPAPVGSIRRDMANLVYSVPTDTLNDITDAHKALPIRHSLIRKHARVRMLTTHRDAHIYFFPYWVAELIRRNPTFENVSEEVLGWWAKAGWQTGLADKLGLRDILQGSDDAASEGSQLADEDIDVSRYSSTYAGAPVAARAPTTLASRVSSATAPTLAAPAPLPVPPLLAYVQPPAPHAPLIRRVDTAPLLLATSLRLAKLTPEDSSPYAHTHRIAPSTAASLPQRCRIDPTSLLADNVSVAEKTNIKECVVGAGCRIGEGARLLRCLLMEGVEIADGVQVTDCVLGRRCRVGKGAVLNACEVQDGQVVDEGTEGRGEKFMRFSVGEGFGGEEEGEASSPQRLQSPQYQPRETMHCSENAETETGEPLCTAWPLPPSPALPRRASRTAHTPISSRHYAFHRIDDPHAPRPPLNRTPLLLTRLQRPLFNCLNSVDHPSRSSPSETNGSSLVQRTQRIRDPHPARKHLPRAHRRLIAAIHTPQRLLQQHSLLVRDRAQFQRDAQPD
ncbi:hypothetical protein C7974DRAFT_468086 [Boeremia exigua]|uniref:uncharacterized protein n=1 Tax=Boeremia exigua TaxID=749465 RepID=UPI001E8EE458|nr:uncharacterized protein C7974DRAFT_468086 [Boeremia exigua]KAH6644464.1 hypothetical protein C7974DRAFT_468086 [Boeremia exigua]